MKKNVNWVQIIGIAGTLLGLAGSLLSSTSEKSAIRDTIKKEVDKALAETKKN